MFPYVFAGNPPSKVIQEQPGIGWDFAQQVFLNDRLLWNVQANSHLPGVGNLWSSASTRKPRRQAFTPLAETVI